MSGDIMRPAAWQLSSCADMNLQQMRTWWAAISAAIKASTCFPSRTATCTWAQPSLGCGLELAYLGPLPLCSHISTGSQHQHNCATLSQLTG